MGCESLMIPKDHSANERKYSEDIGDTNVNYHVMPPSGSPETFGFDRAVEIGYSPFFNLRSELTPSG